MKKPGINEFHDINKFPKASGIFYLGMSMPYLGSVQHPKKMYEYDKYIVNKLVASNTGVHVVYTDNLYFYSDKEAMTLKLKYQKIIENHKQSWLNLIKKNILFIPKAFNFITWNQMMLDCPNFSTYLEKFKEIYKKDKKLRQYVKKDIEKTGRKVSKYTVGYMIEEILLDYLVMKGKVHIHNDYTQGKHKWILNMYPGKPHSSHVYLHQKNFFRLDNKENKYQNCWYDLIEKKLYDFERLDIKTFNFVDSKKAK